MVKGLVTEVEALKSKLAALRVRQEDTTQIVNEVVDEVLDSPRRGG
jgi:hypothetical protein